MNQDEFYRHLGAFRKQWDEAKDLFQRVYAQGQLMHERGSEDDLARYSKQLAKVQDKLADTCRDASRVWLVMLGDMTDAAYLNHVPQFELTGKLEAPVRPEGTLDFQPPKVG
jgi:hypothetical protein